MPWEVEQKFRVNDFVEVIRALEALGVALSPPVPQSDLYFNHPARDFAETDEAFRLRREGLRNYMTYKGPKIDPATKTRREIELPLPSGDQVVGQYKELLEALDFRYVTTVSKRRRTAPLLWHGQVFEVALDEVETLGSFVELETRADTALDDAALDSAKAALHSLAAHLGLTQVERRSYLELLLAERHSEPS